MIYCINYIINELYINIHNYIYINYIHYYIKYVYLQLSINYIYI